MGEGCASNHGFSLGRKNMPLLGWEGNRRTEQGTALSAVCVSRGKDDPTHTGYPARVVWPQVKMGS